jgi:hypothetical protein
MTAKPNIDIILGVICFLLTWLFVGFFRDDEFFEPTIFTKYRPGLKINFYSPIGMQSLSIKDLPVDKQNEEIAFQEFVIQQHQQNNSNAPLWYLPFLLIQVTLTFFTIPVHGLIKPLKGQKKYLVWHFLANVIPTSLIIGFILSFDNLYWTCFLVISILILNILTAVVLTRSAVKGLSVA